MTNTILVNELVEGIKFLLIELNEKHSNTDYSDDKEVAEIERSTHDDTARQLREQVMNLPPMELLAYLERVILG